MAKQPRPQHPGDGQRVVGALVLVLAACWIVWISLVASAECEGSCGLAGWLPPIFSLSILGSVVMTVVHAPSNPERALSWLFVTAGLFVAWTLSMVVAFGFFT
jgi:hypothetical protein